jgi:BlaI family transcriptional regulator, penicillinase repressor
MEGSVRDVTAAELAVLQVLWDLGSPTVREVVERLYPDGGPSAPPTVNKLMERLESKRFVKRDRTGSAQRFTATVDRSTIVSTRLRSIVETLCGGSMTSLLTQLVQTEILSKSDRQALRSLVDEWDQVDGAKGQPGP